MVQLDANLDTNTLVPPSPLLRGRGNSSGASTSVLTCKLDGVCIQVNFSSTCRGYSTEPQSALTGSHKSVEIYEKYELQMSVIFTKKKMFWYLQTQKVTPKEAKQINIP